MKTGDLVLEANGNHTTPARIIEVINSHAHLYYKIHFKDRSILKNIILPAYRLKAYTNY